MQSDLLLCENPSRSLCIKPRQAASKNPSHVLVLEKLLKDGGANQNINCTAKFLPAQSFDISSFRPLIDIPIYGCLGLMQVDSGTCLILEPFVCVISNCTEVGQLEGSKIFRIDNVMFFSLTSNKFDDVSDNGMSYVQQKEISGLYGSASMGGEIASPEQYETLRHPCQQLHRFLSSGSFYFSYDFDLTRCAQKRYQNDFSTCLWDVADNRFFWNENMIRELLKFRRQLPDCDRANLDNEGILVMVTSGFIGINTVQVFKDSIKCAIISRLSCKRAGTRFNTRGIDDDGNVANSVETELLVYYQGLCFSLVIVRGSVPLFWEQQGIQLGSHKVQISRSAAATQPAFERHFQDMMSQYGRVHIINLLSQKEGAESLLTDAFWQQVRNIDSSIQVEMTNFDFHAMVKGNQFDNLSVLTNQVRESIKANGFFLINTQTKKTVTTQQGVFRVNCLDCLDRTNVVEGLLCKAGLNIFLQSIKSNADILYNSAFNDHWADNGDELSRIYTGTGALKSGFTRTGKRTIAGFMDDARKSATRFYMNNFQDKAKQEMIDHLLGKLPNQPSIRLVNPVRDAVKKALDQRSSEFSSSKFIRVHVATWNVNGKQPLGENLSSWLLFSGTQSPEMYIIGFQEIVDLSPQQIMATDMTKRLVWEDLILKTLNQNSKGYQYVNVKSGQLVGAALIVIVRSDCVPYLRNVQGSIKKTGLAGLAGNKGGVAIRMEYCDTTICFVCAHLAAGQSNVIDRNNDYRIINEGLMFEKGLKIDSHEIVIWLGDFNYRISMDNEQVRQVVAANRLDSLFPYDQLLTEMKAGRVFQGFSEATITFAPTYKYDAGTNQYDSSEKNRIPAWTDRILFSGTSIGAEKYERTELLSSDHKPVKALINMEVKVINKEVLDRIQRELYLKFAGLALTVSANCTSSQRGSQERRSARDSRQLEKSKPIVGTLIDLDDGSSCAPVLPPRPITQSARCGNNNNLQTGLGNLSIQDPFSDFAAIKRSDTIKRPENPFHDPFDDPWK